MTTPCPSTNAGYRRPEQLAFRKCSSFWFHNTHFSLKILPPPLTFLLITANSNTLLHPTKKINTSSLTQQFEGRQKQPLLFALTSPLLSHGTVRAWCFLPHSLGTEPYRAGRSMKAQLSPKLYLQALLPSELGRKSGSWSGDTGARVQG